MFEMADGIRQNENDNQSGDENLAFNKNDNKKRELDYQDEDGNLAPLKKTGVEPEVEPDQPDQPDQLNQPTEQPIPVALVLKQHMSMPKDALTKIVCLVVVLNTYTFYKILHLLNILLKTLAEQPHSNQKLRELRIYTENPFGIQNLANIKDILETFTHLLTARSLIIDSDLLGGNTFALGNLTNLSVALKYWPGQPTTRPIRTEFQKFIEKCGVTPERVERSKLREFSFIRVPLEGFQSLDLSTLEVVRPMDERENYEKHIIPCIGKPELGNILTTYEDMITLAAPLAHQLRCKRECHWKWSKVALLVIWLLQGERHWVKATEKAPAKWSDLKTLRYPIPKNVIQMIMFQTSPQDLKAPSKAPVPIKNMGTIIHGAIKDPLVEEWRESCARTDVLRDRQRHLEQRQAKIRRELEKLELDIIRAQEETTQAEAKAAPILEEMEENLRKEKSYLDGTAVRPRAPNRTPEQIAEDKEAKKAKKEAKEKAKNQ